MSHCRNIFPVNVKSQIYNSLFQSYINYCHLVWGTTTQTNIEKLTLLQKKMLRHIANEHYLAHTKPLFAKYKIINLDKMYDYRLLHSFRFSSPEHASLLCKMSELSEHPRSFNTRLFEKWIVPRARTNYTYQSITYRLPLLLNHFLNNNTDIYQMGRKSLLMHFL
ncbi:uncharacterized protein LOC115325325 [Ixodes scapularis]|uniref:uncharacterized protein LOC115325325 n=1 Tax=Ixodes scapularis TaxID=6945 RepID=UPI001A9DA89B|nr:uncharacterized protein LOC115325325 [Ixodes scapularis]